MILNKYKFYNTLNQEIELLPIATFLFDYPDYGKHLAEVVESWAKDSSQISATRIQRKCMIRYEVAEAMLEAFLRSRVAVRLHEPVRIEICLDESEAKHLSEFIIDSIDDRKHDEDKWILQEAMNSAFDFYYTPREEKIKTPLDDFLINKGHLYYYKGDDEDVIIPEGVTHISRFAFKNNERIKSIIFPIGVVAIDEAAFKGCCNLERIVLPQTLKQIGSVVFMDCKGLKEINLPDNLERIDVGIFSGCNNVSKIHISENLCYIPLQMFYGCKKVETVRIPDRVSEIDAIAFGECDALKVAYVPKHTKIADNAFPEHTKIIRI